MNQSKNVSNNHRLKAVVIGALILIAYSVLANTMTTSTIVVMFCEAFSGIAVIGIPLLLYPYFKPFHSKITLFYLISKIIEGLLLILVGILFYINTTKSLDIRDISYVIQTYTFIISAFAFYYLLYKSLLLPKWISLWGIIACILLLTGNILTHVGITLPTLVLVICFSQIMLNEILVAFWLIIKGFSKNLDG